MSDPPPECIHEQASLFAQFACTQSQDRLDQKYIETSIISCCSVLLVCVYLIVLYNFKRSSKLMQLDWDIQTITPGDYTMQMEITDEAYEWFLANVFKRDGNRGVSIGMSLKTYIKNELEKLLTDKLKEVKSSPGDHSNIKIDEVKIADIVFAFNNDELI